MTIGLVLFFGCVVIPILLIMLVMRIATRLLANLDKNYQDFQTPLDDCEEEDKTWMDIVKNTKIKRLK